MKQIINFLKEDPSWSIAMAILATWLVMAFTSKPNIPTFTSFDSIRINTIPVYRDQNQAYYDEELPEGALYIIASEDFIRIKKNSR